MFGGMFVCKNCGSAIVGQIKKGKYIYYSCTDKTKSCPNKKIYLREEQFEKVFDEAIKKLTVTPAHKAAIITALKESLVDEEKYHKEQVAILTQKITSLDTRITRLYTDKLDSVIDNDFWQEKDREWKYELAKLTSKLDAHIKAKGCYMNRGIELVELLENLYPRYLRQNSTEKSKLIKIIFQNFYTEGQNIGYDYKKPFDIFAEGLSCSLDWGLVYNLRTYLLKAA